MAFVTTFISPSKGPVSAYNIDFSIGAGKNNFIADVMLAQALFRIAHFELKNPFAPPPGEKGIEVDGKVGPATLRFILHWQRLMKADKSAVLLDGVFDPFRHQRERSHIANVRYTLELLNVKCFNGCLQESSGAFDSLPQRSDIPPELRGELTLPRRVDARQYQKP